MNTDKVLNLVKLELQRAQKLFPDQERTLTWGEWLAILTEEVGEVARGINDREDTYYMQAELEQVAAMAIRMWLAMEEDDGKIRTSRSSNRHSPSPSGKGPAVPNVGGNRGSSPSGGESAPGAGHDVLVVQSSADGRDDLDC